ncbi:MAG: hypothetical protein ABA06_04735 [Parcubacteria bacterium C7867-001]|nr:MAG: hypothetical protein ABA06_04735 [Parcubacteria bacterium C7867-001]
MEITHTKPNFEDDRGEIRDLVTKEKIDAVTFITYTKGAIRANHYHEHTVQWDYVISGRLENYSRDGFDGEIHMEVVGPGDLVRHPIGEHHALRALEDSVTLAFAEGPRAGEDYENDVVRLTDEQKLVR